MNESFLITVLVVLTALFFDFSNGFHDSANQVAAAISSRSLSPELALTLASLSCFAGAYFLGTKVASTIGRDIVELSAIQNPRAGLFVLMSALLGSISWNLLTWFWGLPSSSSHALIGGLAGAFLTAYGKNSLQWTHLINIFAVMFVSPIVGFTLTYLFTKLTFFSAQLATPAAGKFFKRAQIVSLILQSLAQGTNDAQKTMGVITFSLIIAGIYQPSGMQFVPQWVVLASSVALALGILMGGWKIIKRLGYSLYPIRSAHGFASQASSFGIISLSSFFGFPISTTEVISSSILGAGAAFRFKAVRWAAAGEFVLTWAVTIPASAFISSLIFFIFKLFLIGGVSFKHVAFP